MYHTAMPNPTKTGICIVVDFSSPAQLTRFIKEMPSSQPSGAPRMGMRFPVSWLPPRRLRSPFEGIDLLTAELFQAGVAGGRFSFLPRGFSGIPERLLPPSWAAVDRTWTRENPFGTGTLQTYGTPEAVFPDSPRPGLPAGSVFPVLCYEPESLGQGALIVETASGRFRTDVVAMELDETAAIIPAAEELVQQVRLEACVVFVRLGAGPAGLSTVRQKSRLRPGKHFEQNWIGIESLEAILEPFGDREGLPLAAAPGGMQTGSPRVAYPAVKPGVQSFPRKAARPVSGAAIGATNKPGSPAAGDSVSSAATGSSAGDSIAGDPGSIAPFTPGGTTVTPGSPAGAANSNADAPSATVPSAANSNADAPKAAISSSLTDLATELSAGISDAQILRQALREDLDRPEPWPGEGREVTASMPGFVIFGNQETAISLDSGAIESWRLNGKEIPVNAFLSASLRAGNGGGAGSGAVSGGGFGGFGGTAGAAQGTATGAARHGSSSAGRGSTPALFRASAIESLFALEFENGHGLRMLQVLEAPEFEHPHRITSDIVLFDDLPAVAIQSRLAYPWPRQGQEIGAFLPLNIPLMTVEPPDKVVLKISNGPDEPTEILVEADARSRRTATVKFDVPNSGLELRSEKLGAGLAVRSPEMFVDCTIIRPGLLQVHWTPRAVTFSLCPTVCVPVTRGDELRGLREFATTLIYAPVDAVETALRLALGSGRHEIASRKFVD